MLPTPQHMTDFQFWNMVEIMIDYDMPMNVAGRQIVISLMLISLNAQRQWLHFTFNYLQLCLEMIALI